MNFWPQSGTLSEDAGAAAPASGNSSSKGANGSVFSQGAGMPAINAGEIMLSRAESAALAAMETEPDEAHGLKRAKLESGLNDSQLSMLKRRAAHAISKGMTLKGVGFTKKPTATPAEEPSLLRKAAAKESQVAKEALRESHQKMAMYGLPEHSDWKFPTPHSQGEPDDIDSVQVVGGTALPKKAKPGQVEEAVEANAQSTLARLSMANRHQRRRRA